jgi:hypothetical protein
MHACTSTLLTDSMLSTDSMHDSSSVQWYAEGMCCVSMTLQGQTTSTMTACILSALHY